jgi:hypothetical protein
MHACVHGQAAAVVACQGAGQHTSTGPPCTLPTRAAASPTRTLRPARSWPPPSARTAV